MIEIVLVTSILGLLARALVEATQSMSRITSTGNAESLQEERGERALRSIVNDLRRSGYLTGLNGRNYPYAIEGGNVEAGGNEVHNHAEANKSADPDDPDFGPDRELVFLMPSDVDRDRRPDLDIDGDGIPELDGNGDGARSEDDEDTGDFDPFGATILGSGLVWDHDELSYVLVTRPDGQNYLERRVNGGGAGARRICRGVERVVFDTNSSDLTLPLGAVRVRLFLRTTDSTGTLHKRSVEATVRLRNGGI